MDRFIIFMTVEPVFWYVRELHVLCVDNNWADNGKRSLHRNIKIVGRQEFPGLRA
jgi:hypothetical protein